MGASSKKSYPRTSRVSQLLQTATAQLLFMHTKDRALPMITVTGVEISPDYRVASIFVSVLAEDETDITRTIALLNSERATLRYTLSHTVTMRRVPELRFCDDKTVREGRHLSDLLLAYPAACRGDF